MSFLASCASVSPSVQGGKITHLPGLLGGSVHVWESPGPCWTSPGVCPPPQRPCMAHLLAVCMEPRTSGPALPLHSAFPPAVPLSAFSGSLSARCSLPASVPGSVPSVSVRLWAPLGLGWPISSLLSLSLARLSATWQISGLVPLSLAQPC